MAKKTKTSRPTAQHVIELIESMSVSEIQKLAGSLAKSTEGWHYNPTYFNRKIVRAKERPGEDGNQKIRCLMTLATFACYRVPGSHVRYLYRSLKALETKHAKKIGKPREHLERDLAWHRERQVGLTPGQIARKYKVPKKRVVSALSRLKFASVDSAGKALNI